MNILNSVIISVIIILYLSLLADGEFVCFTFFIIQCCRANISGVYPKHVQISQACVIDLYEKSD